VILFQKQLSTNVQCESMKSNLKWLQTRIKLSSHVLHLLRITFARCFNSSVNFTRLNSLSRERRADV